MAQTKRLFQGPVQQGISEDLFRRTGQSFTVVDPEVAIQRAKESQARRDIATGGAPTTFKDPRTGRVSGLTKGGKTYLDLSPEEAAKAQAGEDFPEFGGAGSGAGGALSLEEANILKSQQEEQRRLETEEYPELRQLDPQARPGSDIPVIGGIATPISNLIIETLSKNSPAFKELVKTPLTPDQLRTAELTEIERRVFEEGITNSEALGVVVESLVESIPFVGGWLAQYTSKLIETPTGNLEEVRKLVNGHRRRAQILATNVRIGILSPEAGAEQIRQIELDIQKAESRIKLLVNYSAQLRFNSDRVNTIELDILRAKEILFAAKVDASLGAIKDPAEMNIYLEAKRLSEEIEE